MGFNDYTFRTTHLLLFSCFFFQIILEAQEKPEIRWEDKARIKEAITIANTYGEKIWDNFNDPPFTIILVTNDYEYLINHPNPSEDFQYLNEDDLMGKVYYRPQQFSIYFLATFPAVNGINCIIMGTPENTKLSTTEWIITLLHERFHQYQYTAPNYHQDALALDLSNGDQTGMWQLNYPFPYEQSKVGKLYEKYTSALSHAIEMLDSDGWEDAYNKLKKRREKFKKSVPINDYKYLSFQWYQEGVARYTEYAFLENLKEYTPGQDIKKLKDFIPFKTYLPKFFKHNLDMITQLKLAEYKRETVYSVGFAETLILRKVNPDWRKDYLIQKFDLELLY